MAGSACLKFPYRGALSASKHAVKANRYYCGYEMDMGGFCDMMSL